jgi:hypothetical protein
MDGLKFLLNFKHACTCRTTGSPKGVTQVLGLPVPQVKCNVFSMPRHRHVMQYDILLPNHTFNVVFDLARTNPISTCRSFQGRSSFMMAWSPQPAGLNEILQTIHESTDSQNPQVQKNITHVSQ